MNAESLISALLYNPSILALVGDRLALSQLPTNAAMPALVYSVVDTVPTPNLSAYGSQLARARVQINPLATTVAEVKQIAAVVRGLMDMQHEIVEPVVIHDWYMYFYGPVGRIIVSSRIDIVDRMEKDNDSGLWTQATDYIVQYYE